MNRMNLKSAGRAAKDLMVQCRLQARDFKDLSFFPPAASERYFSNVHAESDRTSAFCKMSDATNAAKSRQDVDCKSQAANDKSNRLQWIAPPRL
jgi:hypothetical protein